MTKAVKIDYLNYKEGLWSLFYASLTKIRDHNAN